MKISKLILIFALLAISASSGLAASKDTDLFWVSVGEKVPDKYTKNISTSAPFLLLHMPTKDQGLAKYFPDFNLFIFPDTKMAAGLRSDKTVASDKECAEQKLEALKILATVYPIPYKGDNPKYLLQSLDGDVSAGINCHKFGFFPSLSLEVTNEHLEAKLMPEVR